MSRGPSLPVYVSRDTLTFLETQFLDASGIQRARIRAHVDAILAAGNDRGRRWRESVAGLSERQMIARGLL